MPGLHFLSPKERIQRRRARVKAQYVARTLGRDGFYRDEVLSINRVTLGEGKAADYPMTVIWLNSTPDTEFKDAVLHSQRFEPGEWLHHLDYLVWLSDVRVEAVRKQKEWEDKLRKMPQKKRNAYLRELGIPLWWY